MAQLPDVDTLTAAGRDDAPFDRVVEASRVLRESNLSER
jgi:hypothetical protein